MPKDLFHPGASLLSSPRLSGNEAPLCVVGLGGPATTLDGYEGFFLGLPPVSGLAFVVVAPPDAHHGSLTPELLQRCTALPVVPIEDGMALQSDRVYLLLPGPSLTLFGGVLRLDDPARADGRPVDRFFESLALEHREQAIGVLFSGLKEDGIQGAVALKNLGGRVLIELEPSGSAGSSPLSSAALQVADAVLSAEDLMVRLLELTALTRLMGTDELGLATAPLGQILRLMRAKNGHDFTRYKRTTLIRRIDRRMKSHRLQDVALYLQLLEASPTELEALFQDFTINVTSFFRDPEAFEALKDQLRTALQACPVEQETFRVWVAACSTGEEAYSIAIILHELMEELGHDQDLRLQMFATDIDPAALKVARLGQYARDIASVVSPERLSQYFVLKDGGYQVRADLREHMVFATHSTFGDPPFTRLDLLSCRNMLIYVQPELQRQLMGLFAYALKPAGLLLLGASETAGSERDQFVPLNSRWKLYGRGEGAAAGFPIAQSFKASDPALLAHSTGLTTAPISPRTADLSRQLQAALLAEFAPPAVVVDEHGEILFVHGRTARYLELSPGHTPNNVFDLVPQRLRYTVQSAVRQAHTERRLVTRRGLSVEAAEGLHTFDLFVKPLHPSGTGSLMVAFQPRSDGPRDGAARPISDDSGQVLALELELRDGREALQATFEEMAVSMEELRSSNEELQTVNEESQSTNEELMTSKEELQSLNEELNTLNSEHQVIIERQTQANDDTRNLLDNAGTATLFLNNDLHVKRFTPLIDPVVHLTAADEGRPLTDFNVKLRYDPLINDLRRVLKTLEPFEAQVQTHSGDWYLMRISPYRTADNRVDGLVLTFTNIELIKSLEWRLVQSLTHTESVLNEMQDPLLILDEHVQAVTASRALLSWLNTPAPSGGEGSPEGEDTPFDVEELRRRLRAVIATEEPLSSLLLELNVSQQHTRQIQGKAESLMQQDAHREPSAPSPASNPSPTPPDNGK